MLFKSDFSFFPLPLYCLSSWWFFWEGCCYCTCIESLEKGFGSHYAGLGEASKSRGWGGEELERNLLVREWHIQSRFPLHLSDVRSFSDSAFGGFETHSLSWLRPPLHGTIHVCLLVAKLQSGRSHPISDVEFAVPGAELNWHLASSLRVALNLHINLHRSLIGDKCTCFLFIELCKCIHRFT